MVLMTFFSHTDAASTQNGSMFFFLFIISHCIQYQKCILGFIAKCLLFDRVLLLIRNSHHSKVLCVSAFPSIILLVMFSRICTTLFDSITAVIMLITDESNAIIVHHMAFSLRLTHFLSTILLLHVCSVHLK